MELLQPKEVTIADQDGKERVYTLSKFPAIDGREIVAKYPVSMMPKIGDYAVSEETMLKLMSFVAVPGTPPIRLITRALVNNHIPDFETLARVEMAMMEYNCSFFRDGRLSDFLQGSVQKILASISKTLIPSSAQSSPAEEPLSTSSARSTH